MIAHLPKPVFRGLLAVLVAGAVAAPKVWPELQRLSAADPGARPAASRASEAPLRVAGVAASAAPLAQVVTSTGTLLAAESVELQAEVSGKVTAIHFTEGARVSAGALLVKLNDADLKARRAAAAHELALAERRAQRASDLLARGFVVQDDHDAAASAVEVRRAELALIDAQIAKTEIRAPFDGVAGLRHVSEGAYVDASTQIATLQRTDVLKVDFAIPERYAAKVALGARITFTVAGRAEEFEGEVYAYDPRIDPETRTLMLRARCPNTDERLLPGAFANVRLVLAETADALLVPAEALIPDFEAAYVLVAADGVVERRRVVTGVRTERQVQILAGLAPGEIVVTSGLQQLRPGARVNVDLVGPRAVEPPPPDMQGYR